MLNISNRFIDFVVLIEGKLVGKCLYESAMGPSYRFNLNARLAKSFLTQIIGKFPVLFIKFFILT